MQKAYKLQGKHRHYDWGGTQFIPTLMGINNYPMNPMRSIGWAHILRRFQKLPQKMGWFY